MNFPETGAGRSLQAFVSVTCRDDDGHAMDVSEEILAIEAEARSEGLNLDAVAQVLEKLELDCDPQANRLHTTCDHDEQAVGFAREYALAIREAAR